jgi:Insulinase (Peptidase family M16)
MNIHIPSDIGMGFMGIAYRSGSDFEFEGIRGINHLMEHLMSKCFDSLLPKLKRLGLNYEAYTSTDRLVFYFEGLDESLGVMAQELYDLITSGTYTWTEEEFDNERRTIIQEYEDVFNEQVNGTLANTFRQHYLYFGPIGFKPDIESFSYETSLNFRKYFTTPMFVCQVGKQHVTVKDSPPSNIALPHPMFGDYDTPLESVPKKGKTVVGLLSKYLIEKIDVNRVGLVLKCLNDGIESPLLQEIRDKRGLSYFSMGIVYTMCGFGVPTFMSCTSNRNKKKLRKVYTEFFSGDLNRHISKDRFDDCLAGELISKRICEILPYSGAKVTVIEKSPYTDLDGFTYEEALRLLDKHFKLDNFAEIEY